MRSWPRGGPQAAPLPISLYSVLGLVRVANMAQYEHQGFFNAFASSRDELLTGIKAHIDHTGILTAPGASTTNPAYTWMSQFSPTSAETIPGWTLDVDTEASRYLIILRSPRHTYATDETGYIYYAPTPSYPIKATDF